MKFLREWFEKFDEHFFEDFFRDKNIRLVIRKQDTECSTIEGWACAECGEIEISDECFIRLTPYGIRDVLLHEMVHLFVAYTHPERRRVWGDGCKFFQRFERDFQNLRRKEFERWI